MVIWLFLVHHVPFRVAGDLVIRRFHVPIFLAPFMDDHTHVAFIQRSKDSNGRIHKNRRKGMAMATESAQERSGPWNHWNHRGFGLVFGFVIDRLGVRRSMLLGRGPQRDLRGTPGRNRWKPTGNPLETHWISGVICDKI